MGRTHMSKGDITSVAARRWVTRLRCGALAVAHHEPIWILHMLLTTSAPAQGHSVDALGRFASKVWEQHLGCDPCCTCGAFVDCRPVG